MGSRPQQNVFSYYVYIHVLHAAWASYQEALHSEVGLGHWKSIKVDKASSRGTEVGRLHESRAP